MGQSPAALSSSRLTDPRLLSFFDSAFFDAVEREKERYEKPAIELVGDEGGEIVGLLDLECDSDGLYDRPGRGGMIWHLATHPDHQRRGIASMMLHEAERQARERGLVRLEAWTRDDAHVQRWYEGQRLRTNRLIPPRVPRT